MKKTLIMVGAGLEAIPIIQKAIGMGIHVVAMDLNPKAPGFAYAHESVSGCVYTPEKAVAAFRKWAEKGIKPDGVMCAAVDAPHTVAAVAAYFGVKSVSRETAALATDKLAMKDRFKEAGIPIPWYKEIFSADELQQVLSERKESIVIKPVDSRGARGVLRLLKNAENMPAPKWAFEHARNESPAKRVMVESYLDGPQISTEGFVVNGAAYTPGFSDRNYEFIDRFAPHIIENGGQLPSCLSGETSLAVKELAGKAAIALGINNGVAKGDMVVHRGKPYVIEMAARLSGGYFCSHEIPWNTGVDFVGIAVRLAIGEIPAPEEMAPKFQKGVAQRYIFPSRGKVAAIEGVEEASRIEGIRMVEIRTEVGEIIPPVTSHPARAGVVMGVAGSREEAVKRVEKAVRCIKIVTGK
ncbi:ATP-grasp domain-containing protein [Maridesulfovibrio hydrothermalis]|uniref:Phosphoribosylglycinamide synthetase n=1 Tax=Maridesulfovibrio hydrothermalis AM13 = DSM 14728 TaxID=1121451 RepID=L0RBN4_9BACT|nr:ATP-grasp domain-containing protein [Maridesulfovibrio hydrothermalis]CCO23595.1 Phosphoribosylglycinamide synthetase [Maridesulfovibrio hydrothermalis AM13 = DSM 14728]